MKTIVNFILDKSGSMSSVQDSTISGFNEYIQTLQKDKKSKYEFTLTLFDTITSQPHIQKDIKDVPSLNKETYNPDGYTALYDAVCTTIKNTKEAKNQKVLTVIMTDGEENSSKEYTQVEMKNLIEDKEKEGNWKFVYLGANQDSYAAAQKFGINPNNTANFNATARGMNMTMSTMASNTVNFSASSGAAGQNAFFTSTDQDILGNTK